jgi:hypothetical protein
MQLSQIERTLQEMIEKEQSAERQESKQRWSISRLLRRRNSGKDKGARKTNRRSDFVIAGLGITLGLVCALFPWYIFFNPDQFGVQALKFGGDGQGTRRAIASISHTLPVTDALAETSAPSDKLDLFATGTLPDKEEERAAVPNQPFPAEDLSYRLVHVMNGRALIEDETGLWVVQSGAILPDSSRVASIEQRGGSWVLVTSKEKVVELSR